MTTVASMLDSSDRKRLLALAYDLRAARRTGQAAPEPEHTERVIGMTTRACIVITPDGPCLGHPEVDSPVLPPVCRKHLEVFMPLIMAKARELARDMVHQERYEAAQRDREMPLRLRGGRHLTGDLRATADFLRGAA